jgi:hypothetical protein
VTNFYSYPETHEPNSSAISAVFYAVRRQPWDHWATKALDVMKRMLFMALVAASLLALLQPAAAEGRTYEVLSADVPFKFAVGDRTFGPGHYQFIFAATNLVVLRDARQHVVASFVTKWVDTSTPMTETKLVFDTPENKRARLTQIRIQSRSQALEFVGEELAMRSLQPPISAPVDAFFSFTLRNDTGVRMAY